MSAWKHEIQRRLEGLQLRPERSAEIADELEQHLEDRYAALRSAGVGEEDAVRRLLAELDENGGLKSQLSGVERRPAETLIPGEQRRRSRLADFFRDVRYGLRVLRKTPGFTAIVTMTLALGIGANSAVFSVLDAVLLKPLPLPDSDRLIQLDGLSKAGERYYFSWPDFQDLRGQAKTVEGLSAFVPQSVNLTGHGEPIRVRGGFISDNFFRVVGVEPTQGRGFLPGVDDEPGAERVCVVQYEAWQKTFGGAADLIGNKLLLNNEPFTVVGILPQGFRFPFDEIEVWIPYRNWPPFATTNLQDRSAPLVWPFGRLKAGVSLQEARAELESILARVATQFPEGGEGRGLTVRSLHEAVVDDTKLSLLVLFGAVAFVLLIACGNVANLLLARATVRQKELATRAALGASQGRILQQMLTETALLWIGGGLAGIAVGYAALQGLLTIVPSTLPGGNAPGMNADVLFYTLGITALSALLFGLVPAFRASRLNLNAVMKEGGRSGSESGHRTRLRSALVVSQIALALVLLVGCGLMIRSFMRLTAVDPGFKPDHLLTMEYRLPRNKYPEEAQQTEVHRKIVEAVSRVPGVRSATVILALPFGGNGNVAAYSIPERPDTAEDKTLRAQVNRAVPSTFETLGIPVLRGRVFEEQDRAGSRVVAIISQRLAQRFWPDSDPLERQVLVSDESKEPATIVGVVGDIRHYALDEDEVPQIYLAEAQFPHIFNTLAARTEGEPMALARAVSEAVWSVDPEQPVWKVRSMESLLERSVGGRKFLLRLLAAYAGLALLLAAVGIYGVMGYTVAQRNREMGVRMALGADRGSIFRLVVGQGMRLVVLGLVLGIAGALAVTRFLESLLYGVTAQDPLTFAAVALLLAAVALVACAMPARRATRADPLTALRCE